MGTTTTVSTTTQTESDVEHSVVIRGTKAFVKHL